jgi:uncharacterized membrane protein YozB (DUF420 family)
MRRPAVIKRRESGELRILAIALIANSTELLVSAIPGCTIGDIDAAIEHAVDRFVNRNEPVALAIAHGVQHAKSRIMHRNALMLCAAVMMMFAGNSR